MAAVFLFATPLEAKQPVPQKNASPAAAPEIAEKQADLGELRSRIESLQGSQQQ